MPEAIIQGADSTTDTQTEYDTGNKKRGPSAPVPTTTPIPKVPLPSKVPGQPKAPAPDPQTLQEKQAAAINQYIYARAQRYLIGSAFNSSFESNTPGYPKPDTTTSKDYQWWTTHPLEFGNTIGANVTEQQHRKLVKHMPGVYDWMAKHDSLAGVDGALSGMRLTALHITDPTVRDWALNYIDSIKNLSSGDQQAVLTYLMDLHGTSDPKMLLHEALHTRQGYINAMLASPQYQQQVRTQEAMQKHGMALMEADRPGQTPQQAMDFANQQVGAIVARIDPEHKMTLDQLMQNQDYAFWTQQREQAGAAVDQQMQQSGQVGSYGTDFWSNVTKTGAGLISGGAKLAEQGILGQQGAQDLNQGFEQHLAPHIANWWRDGNNLPFIVHWKEAQGGLQSYLPKLGGGLLPQAPASMTAPLTYNATLHHISAQTEVEAAALATGVGAELTFAPGLFEFFGTQATNLAKLQAFMKLLHGVNQVTRTVGNTGQQVQMAGFGGDVLNPVFHLGGTVIGGIAAATHAATSAADNVMLDVQDKLATGTAQVAQNFGWNMSGMQASIAAQIEMAMLMESMGRVGSDIKLNLGMSADAVKGQLGIGPTLADTYRLSDSSIFHPYRAIMDPLIDHGVTQMMQFLHATDLPSVFQRWNDSGFLGRRGMFDIVDGWQTGTGVGPTDYRTVLAKIRERYPMLPQDYAETLARTPRDQMLGASMDYIDSWGVRDFKTTSGQLNSVKAKLSNLDVLQGLQKSVVRYKGETFHPEDSFPEPLMPDGSSALVHAKVPPQQEPDFTNWYHNEGPKWEAQGWKWTEDPVTGSEVMVPPEAVLPGDPGYNDINPPTYQPHPLEGQLRPVYAGHAYAFEAFDKAKFSEGALHGPGLYTTEDPTVAGGDPNWDNVIAAQASGGDLMSTNANLGYAGKHMGPSYDYHEITVPPEMQDTPVRRTNYIIKTAIEERQAQLRGYGEDPANYDISTVLTPSPKGVDAQGNNIWSVATKVIPKGLGEPAPNVHYGFMDIRNPLDLDHLYSTEEANAIMAKALGDLHTERSTFHEPVTGENIRWALAQRLGDAREAVTALQRAGYDGLTHIGGNIMGQGHNHRVWIAFEPEQFHRSLTPKLIDVQNELLAQKAALEDRLATLQNTPNEVISNLPTNSMPDFLHRVMYEPVGPVEQAFRFVTNFGRYAKRFTNWSYRTISGEDVNKLFEDKQSYVSKLVDKLDRNPQLRFASDTMPRAERQIVQDNNAQILDRVLQRIGFSPEDTALIKGRLAAAKTQTEWFDVVSKDLLGSKGEGLHLMDKYLPDNTPTWLRDRILSMSQGGVAPRYYQKLQSGTLGQTEMHNLLDGELVLGSRAPLPAAPSMFKNSYALPMSDIETALGTVSRWRARVGDVNYTKGNVFNNLAAQVFDWGKAGLAITTSVGKPLIMVANIPAIIGTKMLDETMGNAMDPRILRQFHTRAEALDYFSKVDPRILGKVVAGSSWVGLDGQDIATSDVQHTAQEMFMHGMDSQTADSVAQRLVDMSTDPFISRIAAESDPERVLALLYGEDPSAFDPNAPGIIHLYRGSGVIANDTTNYWWKGIFGRDTMSNSHEAAIDTAISYDKNGGYQHFYLDPNAKVLVQGTPEFDALVGPESEFHSASTNPNAMGYVPHKGQVISQITDQSDKGQKYWLDDLYKKAKAAGYQVIHMTEQDALGTNVIDPSILRDPYNTAAPLMADERLQRFFNEQLRPQIERSLEATYTGRGAGPAVTEETVRARTLQLIYDWQRVINDASWSHPDLLDFVKHGRLGGRGIPLDQAAAMDGELAHRYQSLLDEVSGLRENISKLDGKDNPQALVAAQRHLHDKLAEMDHIENTVLGVGDQTDQLLGAGQAAEQVRQDTRKELADHIQKLWKQNELTPPDKFTVRTPHALLQTSSTTDAARSNARRLQDFMYRNGQFQFIGKAEAASAKGSFYAQRADAIAKGYIALGMKPDEAVALAEWKALDETRDMNYDISTKSTAERGIRNLMWFAPVQGELMYRWMYAIPATMGGWLPGAALMTARLANWYHMLKTSNLIHKDKYTGQDVISIPGLGGLITKAAHAVGNDIKLPDTLNIPLLSINPHLFGIVQNPIPTLSPGPSFLLDQAAARLHSPVLKDLSSIVSQGGTNQFVPSAINSVLGMWGINVGTHMLGTSYQRLQWDRAHDVGLQYAYTDMLKSGDTAPTLQQFRLDSAAKNYLAPSTKTAGKIQQEQLAYQVAWAKWFDRLNQSADQYARGAYALSAISSSLIPGYIQESSTDQRAYQLFFQQHILPQIDAGGDTGAISNTINKWLAQHPNSQAFAISYNYYTGKQWDTPFQVTDPQYAKQLYAQGIKAPMDPTDYANFLSGKAMIEGYRAQLNGAIKAAAPDGKWQTLLRNWYQRGTAVEQYTQELNMFDQLNPDALRTYNNIQAKAMQAGHVYPHQGIVYQYVAQAMTDLKLLAPGMFGGEVQGDYKTIISRLGQAKAALYQQFPGAANDPMTKGINWYFDKVISPYYDAVNPLYEKAKAMTAAGASKQAIADVYHQVDLVRQQFDNPGHNAPSPEEFAYASLSPFDQKVAKITWATQPVSWLSKFQYQHVYGNFSPGVNKMFNNQYNFNKKDFLPAYNKTSPSSNYADSLRKWADQQYVNMAQYWQNHGVKDAVKIMALENGVPYQRLQASGWGTNNPGMKAVYDLAKQANDAINAAGDSPAGFSQTAVAWKTWFYGTLNAWMSQPTTKPNGETNRTQVQFLRDMDMLSQSQKPIGTTGIHPSGLSLYEEIFFGNFSLDKYPAPHSITNLFK